MLLWTCSNNGTWSPFQARSEASRCLSRICSPGSQIAGSREGVSFSSLLRGVSASEVSVDSAPCFSDLRHQGRCHRFCCLMLLPHDSPEFQVFTLMIHQGCGECFCSACNLSSCSFSLFQRHLFCHRSRHHDLARTGRGRGAKPVGGFSILSSPLMTRSIFRVSGQ